MAAPEAAATGTTETPGVAAALANWNGAAYLPRCLEALRTQTRPVEEVVVVDNGSTDGSPEWIRENHPQVRVLQNPRNEGYCAGYNRAIGATTAAYVLVLNTDVTLDAGWVAAAAGVLDREAEVAGVTGRFWEQATRRTISGGFHLRWSVRILPGEAGPAEEEVFGATGAAVLFRRSALDEAAAAGGELYDTRYFSYGEDIDLSWRLRALGWGLRYTPGARAHHVGSGSLGGALRLVDKPAVFQRHALKNRYLTLLKNASPRLLVQMGACLLLTDLLLWPYLCLRTPSRVPYLLGGILDAVRMLPGTWTRRRSLQRWARRPGGGARVWLRGW